MLLKLIRGNKTKTIKVKSFSIEICKWKYALSHDVYIYGLFNDSISISEYIALGGQMINEQ
jgi:hypothetical protein